MRSQNKRLHNDGNFEQAKPDYPSPLTYFLSASTKQQIQMNMIQAEIEHENKIKSPANYVTHESKSCTAPKGKKNKRNKRATAQFHICHNHNKLPGEEGEKER